MISHFNVGTNDFAKAEAFFNDVLGLINGKQVFKNERTMMYDFGEGSPKLAVNIPNNEQPATVGNGSMVAFIAANSEQVDAVHAKALELGGTTEGDPGVREKFGIYAAYFRDLDGNKYGIFCQPS